MQCRRLSSESRAALVGDEGTRDPGKDIASGLQSSWQGDGRAHENLRMLAWGNGERREASHFYRQVLPLWCSPSLVCASSLSSGLGRTPFCASCGNSGDGDSGANWLPPACSPTWAGKIVQILSLSL